MSFITKIATDQVGIAAACAMKPSCVCSTGFSAWRSFVHIKMRWFDTCFPCIFTAFWITHYCMKKVFDTEDNFDICSHDISFVRETMFNHFKVSKNQKSFHANWLFHTSQIFAHPPVLEVCTARSWIIFTLCLSWPRYQTGWVSWSTCTTSLTNPALPACAKNWLKVCRIQAVALIQWSPFHVTNPTARLKQSN